MSNIDILSMAVRNLLKRKTRTLLTILGVVIGTASIVVMVSLGLAMDKTFKEQLQTLGDITIVTVYNPGNRYYGSNAPKKQLVLDNNAIQLFRTLPGVLAASPTMQIDLIASAGRYGSYFQLVGIEPEAMEALGYVANQGRLLNSNDKQNVVFGSKAAYNFRELSKMYQETDFSKPPKVDPLMSSLKASTDWRYYSILAGYETGENEDAPPLKLTTLKCVGVLEDKQYQSDNSVFMDINQVKKLKDESERNRQELNASYGYNTGVASNKQTGYDIALVKCTSLDTVKQVKATIDELGYPCEIPSQSLDSMEQIASSLQSLLASIGAVSLLVAALGITNTMITAIYERTREIGIMKVIGASLKDIRKLFLTEAALIGLLGGTFGVILSLLISHFVNTSGMQLFGSIREFSMQTTVSLITPELSGLAILFSTIMGIVSGFFPANRAMNLSALSAIKTE